jgi:flagellar FliL protein
MKKKTPIQEAEASEDTESPKEGGRKRKLILVALIVVLLAAATWWFVLRKPADADAPKPGEVIALDPIQVNLADNHYLSIGIALQAVKGAEEIDGSKALDAVIDLYSGRTVDELNHSKSRDQLKTELEHELSDRYDEEVMEVYLTQFVTQ